MVDKQPLTNSDIDWGKELPHDYTEILKWSNDTNHKSLTKQEVYFLLRKGLHIKNPQGYIFMIYVPFFNYIVHVAKTSF